MANRRFWLGILVMALVFGMAVVGCDNGSGNDGGNNNAKKITITGINRSTGEIGIELVNEKGDGAWGMGQISNSSATVDLLNKNGAAWTGSGSYFIQMYVGGDTDGENYFFTNGKTFAELGITTVSDSQLMTKLPKYSISKTVSTVAFSKFKEVPHQYNDEDE